MFKLIKILITYGLILSNLYSIKNFHEWSIKKDIDIKIPKSQYNAITKKNKKIASFIDKKYKKLHRYYQKNKKYFTGIKIILLIINGILVIVIPSQIIGHILKRQQLKLDKTQQLNIKKNQEQLLSFIASQSKELFEIIIECKNNNTNQIFTYNVIKSFEYIKNNQEIKKQENLKMQSRIWIQQWNWIQKWEMIFHNLNIINIKKIINDNKFNKTSIFNQNIINYLGYDFFKDAEFLINENYIIYNSNNENIIIEKKNNDIMMTFPKNFYQDLIKMDKIISNEIKL